MAKIELLEFTPKSIIYQSISNISPKDVDKIIEDIKSFLIDTGQVITVDINKGLVFRPIKN